MSHWKPPKNLATPDDLAAEPEYVKALRLLRSFRHFVKVKRYGIMCIQIDGQTLIVMKLTAVNVPLTADLTTSVEA